MSLQKASNDLTPPLDATLAALTRPRRKVGWDFWLKWTLATAAGWIFGAFAYSVLIHVLDQAVIVMMMASFEILIGALFGGIIAAMFGFLQGLAIQQKGITLIALCGLIGGAITGYPLMRMLQQSPIQNPKSEI